MTQILKQSTAVDVLIGPFVDSTDGYTSEEGLSPSVLLSKNGQALAAKNDATTPVVDDVGCYNCELDATDTNTVGTLDLVVEGTATALPVKHTFQVLGANAYDALYGSTPTILTSLDIGEVYEGIIDTVNTQTSFDLDTTISTDDNWIGLTCSIEDVSTGDVWVTYVIDVDSANDRIITSGAPPFTAIATDVVRVYVYQHPEYALSNFGVSTNSNISGTETAILDKLLDYVQLLARSDAAINTDNAAALTEINTDEGSGAGDFANTTDSLEALLGTVATSAEITALNDITSADVWAELLGTSGYSASALLQICAGVLAGELSGAATTTITIRNIEDAATLLTATVDASGNRTALTITTPGD